MKRISKEKQANYRNRSWSTTERFLRLQVKKRARERKTQIGELGLRIRKHGYYFTFIKCSLCAKHMCIISIDLWRKIDTMILIIYRWVN